MKRALRLFIMNPSTQHTKGYFNNVQTALYRLIQAFCKKNLIYDLRIANLSSCPGWQHPLEKVKHLVQRDVFEESQHTTHNFGVGRFIDIFKKGGRRGKLA